MILDLSQSVGIKTKKYAFTLVEMLAVISIIVILSVFAVPAFNSILGGRGISKGVNDVTNILEMARAEAMSRRTYVYVGFANVTNADGNSELRIGAALAPDGSLAVTSAQQAALRPISKVIKISNLKSVDYNELPASVKLLITGPVNGDALPNTNTRPLYVHDVLRIDRTNFKVGAENFSTHPRIIFAPGGEIISSVPEMFTTITCVGLAPCRGTTVNLNSPDGAVVVLYGGSAQMRSIRP